VPAGRPLLTLDAVNRDAGDPDRKRSSALESLLAEWRGLSIGEIAFLAPVLLAAAILLLIEPRGPETVIPTALVVGLLAGAGIAVIRRRRNRG
jgi:MYXO-CTERM domain-containing protein